MMEMMLLLHWRQMGWGCPLQYEIAFSLLFFWEWQISVLKADFTVWQFSVALFCGEFQSNKVLLLLHRSQKVVAQSFRFSLSLVLSQLLLSPRVVCECGRLPPPSTVDGVWIKHVFVAGVAVGGGGTSEAQSQNCCCLLLCSARCQVSKIWKESEF